MKTYLYSLLFFISCNVCRTETVYAQVTIEHVTNSSINGSGTSMNQGTTSFIAGNTYIIVVTNSKSTLPDVPTLSANGMTFSQVGTSLGNTVGTPLSRVTVFIGVCHRDTTSTAIATFPANQTGGIGMFKLYVTGIDTTNNGLNSIAQVVTTAVDASANPSITMAPLANSRSAVVAALVCDANPFSATPEAGWTEAAEGGFFGHAQYGMYRVGAADNTPTVTAAASDWAGVAIELKAAATKRRIISVN